MLLLLCAVLGLPCFSTIIPSDGAQSILCTVKTVDGYLSVGCLSPSWGGLPHTTVYTLDNSGAVTSSASTSFSGEPVSASGCSDGIVVASTGSGITSVALIGSTGIEEWVTAIAGEFDRNPSILHSNIGILLAGNISQDSLRIILLSESGSVFWDFGYPGLPLQVRDVCHFDGRIFVLGSSELPGWQSEIHLIELNESGVNPQIQTIPAGPGRHYPEAVLVDERGIFILENSMSESSDMIFETRLIKLDFSLQPEWIAVHSGSSWNRASELSSTGSDFAVCGWTNSVPFSESNRSDLMLIRFNENGQLLWSREYGTLAPDYGLGIEALSDGGFAVSGSTTGDLYQGWIVKTDSLGFVVPQSIEQYQTAEFSAGPVSNPCSSPSFLVNTLSGGELTVHVYDIAGRVAATCSAVVFQGQNTVCMSSSLPDGIYSVRITCGTAESVFRIVVIGAIQ